MALVHSKLQNKQKKNDSKEIHKALYKPDGDVNEIMESYVIFDIK